jgi:cystathionine beta-lyase family protein involved in aluminum resistance
MGREVGCSLDENRGMYLGSSSRLRGVGGAENGGLCRVVFSSMGYPALLCPTKSVTDIIQSITLGSPERLAAFCRGIQLAAPVDSFVTPEAWDMPGYDDPVIMRGGRSIWGPPSSFPPTAPCASPTPLDAGRPYMAQRQAGRDAAHRRCWRANRQGPPESDMRGFSDVLSQ